MGRNKEPVDVILAKGKTAMSRETIERRRAEEVKVPFSDAIPPESLTLKAERDEFYRYAEMLQKCDIMKTLDCDCLANYILARNAYWKYEKRLKKMRASGDIDELSRLSNLQDKAFKQWLSCAKELGMTIISRAKIVVPQAENAEDYKL